MHSLWANPARTGTGRLPVCLFAAVVGSLATGCNSGRQMQTDLYQRELRLQEDEIYRLEDYIEEYQGIVRGYRCKVEDLERDLIERRESRSLSAPTPAAPAETLPAPALTRPTPPDPIDLGEMPEIETPDTLSPPAETPSPIENPEAGGEPPLFQGAGAAPITAPTQQLSVAPREDPTAEPIATVALERAEPSPPNPYPLTQPTPYLPPAANTDGSIRLAIEGDGQPGAFEAVIRFAPGTSRTRFEGEASVMLTDPTLDGRQRRIARWDFSAEEVSTASEAGGTALRLPVALPTEVPDDRPLRVWVRLVEPTGEKRLQAAEVRYTARSLLPTDADHRFASNAPPVRLPPTTTPEPIGSVAETLPSDGWRAAGAASLGRRVDTAVAPASFESDW